MRDAAADMGDQHRPRLGGIARERAIEQRPMLAATEQLKTMMEAPKAKRAGARKPARGP